MFKKTSLLLTGLFVAVLFAGFNANAETIDKTLDPTDCNNVAVVEGAELSAATLSDTSSPSLPKFRVALIKAAEQAHRDGELSRAGLATIRLASLNKRALLQMHNAAVEQMVFDGSIDKGVKATAIDWNKFLAVIKELLPIILEFVKLLSFNQQLQPGYAWFEFNQAYELASLAA